MSESLVIVSVALAVSFDGGGGGGGGGGSWFDATWPVGTGASGGGPLSAYGDTDREQPAANSSKAVIAVALTG
ncbi:hypothetical protein [Jiella pelagia]|uniref:Secreted protein n=1 Tax=Jiella pelagia TaxID=2986949 RepID=A0ABY7BVD6_9HYPH|nr:hypothetical protein [Jiella pelagia]WAP67593.1 hypothetical protein OH818_19130 [Jiella pelagia]